MIRSSIEIDKVEYDFYDAFGFIYLGADRRTAPDEKEDAVTNYAGEHGEHRDGRTCYAPFDYKAEFLIEAKCQNLDNVNTKIREFNSAIREQIPGSAVMRKKKIIFYNHDDRVRIVGVPQLISEPTELYHSPRLGAMECAKVELVIRVTDPDECDFCLEPGANKNYSITMSLSTDGTDVSVSLSRPLEDGEALLLMRRGRASNREHDSNKDIRYKSSYTWHVNAYGSTSNLQNILQGGKIKADVLARCAFYAASTESYYGVKCRESSAHTYFKSASAGWSHSWSFACAVYRENLKDGKRYIPKRISNVAYFQSHCAIDNAGTGVDDMEFRTWFST